MAPRKSSSRRGGTSIWTILGLLVLLVAIYYVEQKGWLETGSSTEPTALPPSTSQPPANTSASVGDAVQAYFTTPNLVYPDRAAQRELKPIEQAIVTDLDRAKSTIDMATYEYNLPSIADALLRAKKRGVTVRLALDRENLDNPTMADFAGTMEKANIPIHWEETDAFLHSKFIVIDQGLLWMGSWNATINDTYRNNNNLLRITIPQIVQNYAAEFAQMAEDQFGKKKQPSALNTKIVVRGVTIQNYFSPKDGVRQHVIETIGLAKKSIRFLAFSFTDDSIKDALLQKQQAGLTIQGVFEKRNAGGIGSEFDPLKNGDIDVLEDGNCYTMHHKVIVIDDHIVITGSYNFTARAEDVNDENVIIIDDSAIAQQYIAEFERVYSQARQPTRCG